MNRIDPVIITVYYVDGVADHSEINYIPRDGLKIINDGINASNPKQLDASFPDTCVIEYRFNPNTGEMTYQLITTVDDRKSLN